jgi:hypothetical protein
MSSYCDIDKLNKDATEHPFFTERLNTWKSGPDGANGCNLENKSTATRFDNTNCLTKDEHACYSSYKLGTTRQKLDASLVSVYQPQSSTTASFDSNYNTTMLTGVVWAALGTTVLYYAFTKI